LRRDELVRDFVLALMLVISFARLVVITKDTMAIHDQSKAIFNGMTAPGKRNR
jgi:hypothetical protein